jgi:hypothetical protein
LALIPAGGPTPSWGPPSHRHRSTLLFPRLLRELTFASSALATSTPLLHRLLCLVSVTDRDPILFFFCRAAAWGETGTASWGEMGATAWERWWRWHEGRQGPWIVAVRASLPLRRCPRSRHQSCSSHRQCRLCRRRYSGVVTSPHLVLFSRWLTGRRLTSPAPLDALVLGATTPLLSHHASARATC